MFNACEVHDEAGHCTKECLNLLWGMMNDGYGGESMIYSDYLGGTSSTDVSGCHRPKPMPWEEPRLDITEKRIVYVKIHPEDCQCELHDEDGALINPPQQKEHILAHFWESEQSDFHRQSETEGQ